jgi:hypothetical protein
LRAIEAHTSDTASHWSTDARLTELVKRPDDRRSNVPATDEPNSLSAFIQRSHRDIIEEFAAFARTLMPPNSAMSDQELRDHSEELLVAIAEDLDTEQTSHEQSQKSRGYGNAHIMKVSGRLHADARFITDLPSFMYSGSSARSAPLSCVCTNGPAVTI